MIREEFDRLFKREIEALFADTERVILDLSKMEAWMLFAELQFALRHPENTGPSARVAHNIAKQIEQRVATTAKLRLLATAGWDPKFDEWAILS